MNARNLTIALALVTVAGLMGTSNAVAAPLLPGTVDHINAATKVNVIGENGNPDIGSDRIRQISFRSWRAANSWFNNSWSDPFGDGDAPGGGSSFPLWNDWDNKTVSTPDWGGAIAFEWSTPVNVDEVRLFTDPNEGKLPTAWHFWFKRASDGTWFSNGADVDNTSDGSIARLSNEEDVLAENIITLPQRETVSRMVLKFGNRSQGQARVQQLEVLQVPEPASLALLGLGGLMLVGRRQRKA